jgi:hypothetical protein
LEAPKVSQTTDRAKLILPGVRIVHHMASLPGGAPGQRGGKYP